MVTTDGVARPTWPDLAPRAPTPEPFPAELVTLIAADRQQLAVLSARVQGMVLGFFTARGETNLKLDLAALTVTRLTTPDDDRA